MFCIFFVVVYKFIFGCIVLVLKGNFGYCNSFWFIILNIDLNFICFEIIFLLKIFFFIFFGGEFGLNGFSVLGGFFVFFNGGRVEIGKK